MSLDKNLFTLNIAASNEEAEAIDLTDPNGIIHYRKRKARPPSPSAPQPPPGYAWDFYEPLSDSLLVSVTAQNATSKHKTIQLYNPDVTVAFTFTGTLSFKWSFRWEQHDFEWKKDSCYLLRKPDPPVLVAVAKEQIVGKVRTGAVQLLDYNLNRFDIDDRKGLEVVILAALLTFSDQADEYRAQRENGVTEASASGGPPPPPAKSPIEVLAGLQAREKAASNEIIVGYEAEVDDYAQYCANILRDPSILYIIIRAKGPEQVSKVVQVAESTKRVRHRDGVEEQLHQYLSYDEQEPKKKGPKVIKLDDGPSNSQKDYKPPTTLTIHLSKIPMPELQPKPVSLPPSSSGKKQQRGQSPKPAPGPSGPLPPPQQLLHAAPATSKPPKPPRDHRHSPPSGSGGGGGSSGSKPPKSSGSDKPPKSSGDKSSKSSDGKPHKSKRRHSGPSAGNPQQPQHPLLNIPNSNPSRPSQSNPGSPPLQMPGSFNWTPPPAPPPSAPPQIVPPPPPQQQQQPPPTKPSSFFSFARPHPPTTSTSSVNASAQPGPSGAVNARPPPRPHHNHSQSHGGSGSSSSNGGGGSHAPHRVSMAFPGPQMPLAPPSHAPKPPFGLPNLNVHAPAPTAGSGHRPPSPQPPYGGSANTYGAQPSNYGAWAAPPPPNHPPPASSGVAGTVGGVVQGLTQIGNSLFERINKR